MDTVPQVINEIAKNVAYVGLYSSESFLVVFLPISRSHLYRAMGVEDKSAAVDSILSYVHTV